MKYLGFSVFCMDYNYISSISNYLHRILATEQIIVVTMMEVFLSDRKNHLKNK